MRQRGYLLSIYIFEGVNNAMAERGWQERRWLFVVARKTHSEQELNKVSYHAACGDTGYIAIFYPEE